MMTKTDKKNILQAFKMVDVKKLNLDHQDPEVVKWFRFGNYNALQIATDIVKQMPEVKTKASLTSKTK